MNRENQSKKFVMNMVHHNPGEEPFETKYLNPLVVKEQGGNVQVFKHINTALNFSEYDPDIFEGKSEELQWINELGEKISIEIDKAKKAGLQVFYHIDLFLLPKAVYQKYYHEICDENGKISLFKPKTLEIHQAMFDEMFRRFPIDGLIIRVGETYLHDTPYHIGNGAVQYGEKTIEQASFIKLIDFLRSEICEKHDKYLFFRTWDMYPDKFHADLNYYLEITDRIMPHPKLGFSIKHTALDFWRRVKFNDCITQGKHQQIIEVQCQREYEGKGAYPMYIMNGVINSFDENNEPKGLRDVMNHPLVCGLYIWPRGGGWHGPYIKNEFWCEMNNYVISHYGENPSRSEEEIFHAFAKNEMKLTEHDAKMWRKLCLTSNEAVLKGRYVECYDRTLNEKLMPCCNWMRDDGLGGMRQLEKLFSYLYEHDLLEASVREKKEACRLWEDVYHMYEEINIPDKELSLFIKASIDYAMLLFQVVFAGWEVMVSGYRMEHDENKDITDLKEALSRFDDAWEKYQSLAENPYASTLYKCTYVKREGLDETIDRYKSMI